MDFQSEKQKILEDYSVKILEGFVDIGVLILNKHINSIDTYVTTSSCAGRVIIISKSSLRSKYETEFHVKTHSPEDIDNLSLNQINFKEELWLLFEPPNFHVRCKDLSSAKELVTQGLRAKMGKTKYQSISPVIVVELLGTASLQVPLGVGGKILVNKDHFELIKLKAKEMLTQEQARLSTLISLISE